MNQLVDGMDNQAPGLNFSVGNIAGLNELDVDNVELLPGASSALYGSGGMTGTILMTSKDPYKYQGLSAEFKQGVNHISDPSMGAAPYYDIMARYAKSFNKFAFRISADYIEGKDWTATNYSNYSPIQGSPLRVTGVCRIIMGSIPMETKMNFLIYLMVSIRQRNYISA